MHQLKAAYYNIVEALAFKFLISLTLAFFMMIFKNINKHVIFSLLMIFWSSYWLFFMVYDIELYTFKEILHSVLTDPPFIILGVLSIFTINKEYWKKIALVFYIYCIIIGLYFFAVDVSDSYTYSKLSIVLLVFATDFSMFFGGLVMLYLLIKPKGDI